MRKGRQSAPKFSGSPWILGALVRIKLHLWHRCVVIIKQYTKQNNFKISEFCLVHVRINALLFSKESLYMHNEINNILKYNFELKITKVYINMSQSNFIWHNLIWIFWWSKTNDLNWYVYLITRNQWEHKLNRMLILKKCLLNEAFSVLFSRVGYSGEKTEPG